AAGAAADLGRYRVLDVGCGSKPYYPFFAPYATEYVGVDVDNPAAELEGAVESLPAEDGSFDVVLCTQVLEHAVDPPRAIRELASRVNRCARALDTRSSLLSEPRPGTLFANYHIVAQK